jgi:hypothetical protein
MQKDQEPLHDLSLNGNERSRAAQTRAPIRGPRIVVSSSRHGSLVLSFRMPGSGRGSVVPMTIVPALQRRFPSFFQAHA